MNMSFTINDEDRLTLKLHECIRHKTIFAAESLVRDLSRETRQRLTRANDKLGIRPALFVAIEENDIAFVDFVVNKCNADIEEKFVSTKTFDPEHALSPLELTLYRYQYRMFHILLIAGADPTSLVNDKKTLIRACYNNSWVPLDILQTLADRGADFNVSDDYQFTCLMHAVPYVDRCRFLVDRGVDLNAKNSEGEAALHIAAKKNYYDSVKVLVENGADPYCKNNAGCDSLHVACLNCCEETMRFLLQTAFQDVNRQIESFQLLGNSFLSLYFDITKTLTEWKKATELFVENQIQRSAATLNTPFGVAVEALSSTELESLILNHDLISMQSLVLTHKIFGPNHEMFFCSIASCAERYCKAGLFDQWMQMVTYSLQMILDSSIPHREGCAQVEKLLFTLFWRFANLFENNVTFSYDLLYEFMKAVVQIVRKYIEFDEKKMLGDLIYTSMVPFFSVAFEDRQTYEFKQLVRCAVATIRGNQKRTVLIDALCRWIAYGKPVATFPLLAAVTMLLDCGADVNERDKKDNNVVHFLYKSRSSVFSLREIAVRCVEDGIHLDVRNRKGMTTSECLEKFQIMKTPPINLMCIASRGILQHRIRVKGILPQFLIDFVEMHRMSLHEMKV